MLFMQWLRSLGDLLYEVMSWVIFFPVTLWRVLTHPLRMMAYVDKELTQPAEDQFVDTLNPPLFLVLALLVSHAIGLALGDDGNAIIENQQGLAGVVSDQISLLMLRLLLFSFFPSMMGTQYLRLKKQVLTRKSLQAPFYAQCLITAPFAIVLGVGTLVLMPPTTPQELVYGLSIDLVAIVIYLVIQTRWLTTNTGCSFTRGAVAATMTFLEGALLLGVVAYLFSL